MEGVVIICSIVGALIGASRAQQTHGILGIMIGALLGAGVGAAIGALVSIFLAILGLGG